MPVDEATISDDAILNGRLRLYQPRRGHRFGHDAVLLAAAVPAQPGERVAEFGAGVGAASLALLARVPGIDVTLIERDPALSALCARNIARNGFDDRARAIALDVTDDAKAFHALGIGDESFDHILMNPPFNDASHASPDAQRRAAHARTPDLLARWLDAAAQLLRPGGVVTLIWRADDEVHALEALAAQFGVTSRISVHGVAGRPAIRHIFRAAKGHATDALRDTVLVLNGSDHQPTPEAEGILRHAIALD